MRLLYEWHSVVHVDDICELNCPPGFQLQIWLVSFKAYVLENSQVSNKDFWSSAAPSSHETNEYWFSFFQENKFDVYTCSACFCYFICSLSVSALLVGHKFCLCCCWEYIHVSLTRWEMLGHSITADCCTSSSQHWFLNIGISFSGCLIAVY